MINELFVAKSFFMMGSSLGRCFGCSYCRRDGLSTPDYLIPPGKVNSSFRFMPVVVNCFYGDPALQINNTRKCLEILRDDKHIGPVIIMTKGFIRRLLQSITEFVDLDVHVCLSTIGTHSVVDKISWKSFQYNLEFIEKYDKIKFSCDFKPIMFGINHSEAIVKTVLNLCGKHGLPLCYCGLRTTEAQKERWEGTELKAFPDSELSIQKHVSTECKDTVIELADEFKVPVFRKTSCLLSYVHNLEHDYNVHYWTRSNSTCSNCLWKQRCNKVMQTTLADISEINIPWNYKLAANGHLVIREHLTSSDIRVLKWVTKREIDAPFTYVDHLSDAWYSLEQEGRNETSI